MDIFIVRPWAGLSTEESKTPKGREIGKITLGEKILNKYRSVCH